MWARIREYVEAVGGDLGIWQAEALSWRWGSLVSLGAVADGHPESKGYENWRFFQT